MRLAGDGPSATRTRIPVTPNLLVIAICAIALAALLSLALAPRAEAYIYWTNSGGEPGTSEETNPTIGRANLDGTGVKQDFIVLPLRGGGGGIAVDAEHIYWTTPDGSPQAGSIGRANLDGTAPNHSFIADVNVWGGVAVDDGHVYWVSKFGDDFGFKPNSGAIGRANLNGTGVDENFITGLNFPAGGLAVDSSHLYWPKYAGDPYALYASPTRIGRSNLDGSGVEENFMTIGGGDLAVTDSHVWWARQDRFGGGIERANLDGTGAETVIGGENFFPSGLAVDDTYIYWTDGLPGPGSVLGGIGRARLYGSGFDDCFISGASGRDLAVDALGPQPTERGEPQCPANEFSFVRLKKNKRRGTAKLTVNLPFAGDLQLAKNRKVKGKGIDYAMGEVKLSIKPRRKTKQKLNEKGKAKVKAEVIYTPDVGDPNARTKPVKLIKRR